MREVNITFVHGLDGELFARQRALVIALSASVLINSENRELLEGLTTMLDVVADQAADRYGIDCLLKEHHFPVKLDDE
jgi:hypothetical protein